MKKIIKKIKSNKIMISVCLPATVRGWHAPDQKNCEWLPCEICGEIMSVSEKKRNLKKTGKPPLIPVCYFCGIKIKDLLKIKHIPIAQIDDYYK